MSWLKADILTVAWFLHAHTHTHTALARCWCSCSSLVKGWGRALNGFPFHSGASNGVFVNGDSEWIWIESNPTPRACELGFNRDEVPEDIYSNMLNCRFSLAVLLGEKRPVPILSHLAHRGVAHSSDFSQTTAKLSAKSRRWNERHFNGWIVPNKFISPGKSRDLWERPVCYRQYLWHWLWILLHH